MEKLNIKKATCHGFQDGKHGIDYVSGTIATTKAVLQNEGCINNVMQLVFICELGYH
jgi:hypothetical protein